METFSYRVLPFSETHRIGANPENLSVPKITIAEKRCVFKSQRLAAKCKITSCFAAMAEKSPESAEKSQQFLWQGIKNCSISRFQNRSVFKTLRRKFEFSTLWGGGFGLKKFSELFLLLEFSWKRTQQMPPSPRLTKPILSHSTGTTTLVWPHHKQFRLFGRSDEEFRGCFYEHVFFGQETKHVKIGHVKIDRAHFRVHFREHWKISREHWKFSREHSRGSFRGDPLLCFTQKKPQPSWAFSWAFSCTLSWAFSWALSWESSWVKFRGSRALCSSDESWRLLFE